MTEMKFRKKLVWRAWLASALTAIGMTLTVLTMTNQGGMAPTDNFVDKLSHIEAFGAGYYYGVSLGLTLSGMVTFIKTIIQLKNEAKFKKIYIMETDERNIEIIRKAKSVSWYTTLFGILVATFFVNPEMIAPLLCIGATMVGIFAITYFILQKTS